MKFSTCFLILLSLLTSCESKEDISTEIDQQEDNFISAVDISSFPEIESTHPIFYGRNGEEADFLSILKKNGVNTIRLRLWVNPIHQHSTYQEVKTFTERLRHLGFKIWLTLHYSDTWADPAQQETPLAWQELSYKQLKNKVSTYTKTIAEEIQPDFIQIGNEINSGFLHPKGNLTDYPTQFKELMTLAIAEVRDNSPNSKIIIHYAGLNQVNEFYSELNNLDYDIIGLSYYPIWHGKELLQLDETLKSLSKNFNNKKIIIAETAYPFTLDWNDWTNNILGQEDQLILPEYPATPQGQAQFINTLKNIVAKTPNGIGFCYWGAELIAWKGEEAEDASSWENQALFDFENQALPVIKEFK